MGHAKQAGRREREGQLLAGPPAGQAEVWAESEEYKIFFQIPSLIPNSFSFLNSKQFQI